MSTDDLPARLRNGNPDIKKLWRLAWEAADEIERLRSGSAMVRRADTPITLATDHITVVVRLGDWLPMIGGGVAQLLAFDDDAKVSPAKVHERFGLAPKWVALGQIDLDEIALGLRRAASG